MKKTPPGWPRISSSLVYDDASVAITWLCKTFDFRVRIRVVGPNGRVVHSELVYGDGLIMVGEGSGKRDVSWRQSPSSLGGACTQALAVYVDDVEAHCKHARKAGARILSEPTTTDHGEDYWADRSYEVVDLGGHHWWFMQRMRTAKPKKKAAAKKPGAKKKR